MADNVKRVATIGNSIIGVSILAMPFCFKQCGIVLGILMLIVSAVITRFNCHLLLKGALMCRRKSYELLAFHSFGYYGKLAVEASIIGFLVGMLISFYVVIGDLGPPIVGGKLEIESLPSLRTIVLTAIGLGVVLPLGLLKNIDSLGGISAISILFYIFLVLKVFFDALPVLASGDWINKVNYWKPQGIFQSLPIFAMALSCQTQIFEIYNVLPDPSLGKMNKLIKMAIYLSTTIYVSVGFFGYVAFCNEDFYGNILVTMPSTYMTTLIKLGFIWSVVVSFPLVIFPCRASLCSFFNKKIHTGLDMGVAYIPEPRFRLTTIFLVVSTLILGILCPNIELVLGLVGSTIGTTICIIFPALMFVKVTNRETFERTLAQITFCAGLFLLVTCTFVTIHDNADSTVVDSSIKIQKPLDQHLDKFYQKKFDYSPMLNIVKATPLISLKEVQPNEETKDVPQKSNDEVVKREKDEIAKPQGRQEPPIPQEPENSNNNINENSKDKSKVIETDHDKSKVIENVNDNSKDVDNVNDKSKNTDNVNDKNNLKDNFNDETNIKNTIKDNFNDETNIKNTIKDKSITNIKSNSNKNISKVNKVPENTLASQPTVKVKPKVVDNSSEQSSNVAALKQEAILKQLAQQQKEILQQQKQVLAELKAHKDLHIPPENIAQEVAKSTEKQPPLQQIVQQQREMIQQQNQVLLELQKQPDNVTLASVKDKEQKQSHQPQSLNSSQQKVPNIKLEVPKVGEPKKNRSPIAEKTVLPNVVNVVVLDERIEDNEPAPQPKKLDSPKINAANTSVINNNKSKNSNVIDNTIVQDPVVKVPAVDIKNQEDDAKQSAGKNDNVLKSSQKMDHITEKSHIEIR